MSASTKITEKYTHHKINYYNKIDAYAVITALNAPPFNRSISIFNARKKRSSEDRFFQFLMFAPSLITSRLPVCNYFSPKWKYMLVPSFNVIW